MASMLAALTGLAYLFVDFGFRLVGGRLTWLEVTAITSAVKECGSLTARSFKKKTCHLSLYSGRLTTGGLSEIGTTIWRANMDVKCFQRHCERGLALGIAPKITIRGSFPPCCTHSECRHWVLYELRPAHLAYRHKPLRQPSLQ